MIAMGSSGATIAGAIVRGCDALRRDEVEAKLRQGAQGYNYSIDYEASAGYTLVPSF